MMETVPTMSISKIVNLMKSYMTYHIWERYPKFKSRHDSHKAYTTNFTNGNITVDFNRDNVKLLRNFSGQIKSATVSQVPSGKYYVLLLMGRNTKIPK